MTEKTPYDDYDMTQQEVADALDMSRPHVGSVEARAREKFRMLLEQRGITFNDLIWR
jgi:DNA-directed RNA polymerase specialized sigma24 family protein